MAVKALIARMACGWCLEGRHGDGCIINVASVVPHAKNPDGLVWICPCCGIGNRRCTTCNNRNTEEVSETTYKCLDVEACNATMEGRRAASPILAEVRESRKRAEMAKVENAKTAKTAAPKTGTCVCGCKGTTKGGLFLPGHDARFVSQTVATVESANFSKSAIAAGAKTIKDSGASESLQAKFVKAVGLAQTRKEKKDAAAKEKADAKAEKAKDKASK